MNERAWEHNLQHWAESYVQHKRDRTRMAVGELRLASIEAICNTNERAVAQIAESREHEQVVAHEFHVARQGERQGEVLRHAELGMRQLDDQRRQLQAVDNVRGQEHNFVTAEIRHELTRAQEQLGQQQAIAERARFASGCAQH